MASRGPRKNTAMGTPRPLLAGLRPHRWVSPLRGSVAFWEFGPSLRPGLMYTVLAGLAHRDIHASAYLTIGTIESKCWVRSASQCAVPVTCTKGPAQIIGTCQIFSTEEIADEMGSIAVSGRRKDQRSVAVPEGRIPARASGVYHEVRVNGRARISVAAIGRGPASGNGSGARQSRSRWERDGGESTRPAEHPLRELPHPEGVVADPRDSGV
jgi:hypothetical protein